MEQGTLILIDVWKTDEGISVKASIRLPSIVTEYLTHWILRLPAT
jgi:hypothetical protein